jgi:transposase-like protein/transposase Tn5 family protein
MANQKPSVTSDSKLWAQEEFGKVLFKDKRLKSRLIKIAQAFAAAPQANIPQACGDWAATKGSYRFFSHESVTGSQIMASHREATLERMRGESLVFAVQDSTYLNFTTHRQTSGLGPIGNNADKTIGLMVHSTLVLKASALALGVLDMSVSARDPKQFAIKSKGRNRQKIQDKESFKWIQGLSALQAAAEQLPAHTRVVSISDRESDLYELFLAALQQGANRRVDLLVRARHERTLEPSGEGLWQSFAQGPRAASMVVQVPRQPGVSARAATLSIRFAKVSLRSPVDRQKYQKLCEPLELWAIEAKEQHPPQGMAPLCWRLLTSMALHNAEQAMEKVRWYTLRWQIEVFHKVLKSGCKVEQRQLESASRLERCLALDMVVAWRILALSKVGIETPGVSAAVLLAEEEWKALYCYMHKTSSAPKESPNLGQALRWIGQLGGFLGRKGDGNPGPIVLWRGLQRLSDLTEAWLLFHPKKTVGNA